MREDESSKQSSPEKKTRQDDKLVESKTSPDTPSHALVVVPSAPSKPNHLQAPLEGTEPVQLSEAAQVCLFSDNFFLLGVYKLSEFVAYHIIFLFDRAKLTRTRQLAQLIRRWTLMT